MELKTDINLDIVREELNIKLEKNSKRVLVICGVHGNESNAVKVTLNILNKLRKEFQEVMYGKYNGGLLENFAKNITFLDFLMGANISGLRENVREVVEDSDYKNDDLNRNFKWFEDDIYDIKKISDNIKIMSSGYDIIIDIHNSPHCQPSLYFATDSKLSSLIKAAKKSNINYIVSPYCQNGILKNYINNETNGIPKLGLTVELNNMGICLKDDLEKNENFIINLLNNIQNFYNIEKNTASNISSLRLVSPAEGIIYFNLNRSNILGHYYSGEKVCDIYNFDGLKVGTVFTPFEGRLTSLRESYYITIGDCIGEYQA